MMQKAIKNNIFLIIGILLAIISCVPYWILGENSIVTYHDQLDGELITYILNAKYMFSNVSVYPELMNGIPKNGMVSPAPLFIILYRLFKPYIAFCISMLIIRLISFSSMYILLKEIKCNNIVSFVCALFFMILPFYTVYGLCIPGQPILIYSLIKLYKIDKNEDRKSYIRYYLYIVLYALGSSLALVGYAWVVALTIISIVMFIKRSKAVRYVVATLALTATYALANFDLVKQLLLGNDGFVSHKSEVVKQSVPFFQSFVEILKDGTSYVETYQVFFIPVVLIAFVLCWKVGREYRYPYLVLIGSNLVIALQYAFFDSKPFVDYCNSQTGIVREFNFSRFIWLMPTIWVILLALSITIIYQFAYARLAKLKSKVSKTLMALVIIVIGVPVCASMIKALYNNDLRYNLMKMYKRGDYYMMTWKQFFAEDLFEEVDEIIGRDKSDYRVASFGIYPAAAAYNGFYCLDAYSNNYDVDYKHEFRKVIAPTLEQSDYLKNWFDGWGNRCYLILPDTGTYCTMEKRWTPYTDQCCFNFEALKSMGCEYIISASYFINSDELGIELLNQEPIQNDDSWYRLWVYKI